MVDPFHSQAPQRIRSPSSDRSRTAPSMAHHASEAGRTEQIISQFFLKTLQAVLAARIPNLARPLEQPAGAGGSSPASATTQWRRRDRWFNLAIGDLPPELESPVFLHRGMMEPMVVDIMLLPQDVVEPVSVIERWTVQCEASPPWAAGALSPGRSGSGEGSSSAASLCRMTYKKSILLLRSIYSYLRFLPAYRAFRLLSSSNNSSNYKLYYKILPFTEPFSRDEEKGFKLQAFTPLDTQFGHLSVSVLYRPTLSDFHIEVSSLLPSMIIADYVGSPVADPMRAFPASPSEKCMRPVSFPLRGVRTLGPPVSQRPHSWTPAPMTYHQLNTLDALAERRASPSDYFGKRMSILQQSVHRKGSFSFDEYRFSPPFSASPTPSPPAHVKNAFQARLRSETAPVSIPQPLVGKNQFHRTPNYSDPTRSLLPPPSPRSARVDLSLEESPSASRSFRKLDPLKVGDLHSHLNSAPKALKDAKDDSGRFSSVFSSCGSPRFVFSRSSSRKSLQDDLEDFDFSCPFAVDDVDTSESQSRNRDHRYVPEPAQASAQRSRDAAVGALVHMLRTAPPLRQDHCSSSSQSSKSPANSEAGAASFFASRKKSDALDELRSYRDMKEILLSKSRSLLLDSQRQATK